MNVSEMTAEQKAREISDAESEIADYEDDIWYKEREYDRNSTKISRLKTVKTNLASQKANAEARYDSLKEKFGNTDTFGEWYGDKCTSIQGALNDSIVQEYKGYVDRIDDVLDAVCNEITRLENRNIRLNGDILYLGSLVNSLANWIETLCN